MDESIKYRLRTPGTAALGPGGARRPDLRLAPISSTRRRPTVPLSLKAGDKVKILATGAYTSTYSSVAFNGFAPLKTDCI